MTRMTNKATTTLLGLITAILFTTLLSVPTTAQIAPRPHEVATYKDLHKAAHEGDVEAVKSLIAGGVDLERRDPHNRSAFHIAGFAGHHTIMRLLAEAGANVNAYERGLYDVVTIAAVANDVKTMALAIEIGNHADNITSIYDGTALIAAAHLGHHVVVRALIKAGAPLDHVNNLHWTALIEAVVLGDGGEDHQKTVKLLVDAGANQSLTDRDGRTALDLAKERGYDAIVTLLNTAN